MPPSRIPNRVPRLGTVRLRCPVVHPAEYAYGSWGVPLWRVYLDMRAGSIELTGGGLLGGGKINEPLDCYVECPDWATGVRGGYLDGIVKYASGRWNHVILVSPDKHDPDKAWIGSDRPRVRFDDADLTVPTTPPGVRGERKPDDSPPGLFRAERPQSPFAGGTDRHGFREGNTTRPDQ